MKIIIKINVIFSQFVKDSPEAEMLLLMLSIYENTCYFVTCIYMAVDVFDYC